MDEKSEVLGFFLEYESSRGRIIPLAEAYQLAKSNDVLKNDIETALNVALENSTRSVGNMHAAQYDVLRENSVIYDFLMKYDLPESTQIKSVQVLAKVHRNIFAIAELVEKKQFSENVKTACEDAIIEFTKIPEKSKNVASVYVETIAKLRKKPLKEKVEKACDDAMVKAMKRWGEEGRTDAITGFIAEHGWVSNAVKDAAANALKKLENISEAEFVEVLDDLAWSEELTELNRIFMEAKSPRTKEHVENAMIKAMVVAGCENWEMRGLNGASIAEYVWMGPDQSFKNIIDNSSISDKVKDKAREILHDNEGFSVNPPAVPPEYKQTGKSRGPDSTARIINLYLLQERRRFGGEDALSKGTVPAPKGGNAEQKRKGKSTVG